MAKNPEVVGIGHLVYDIRDYVQNFPQPDKTAFMRMPPQFGPGGSAANVAMNCVKLNHSAGLVANVGEDMHGKFLMQELRERGVEISQIKKVKKGRTGLSLIIIDKAGQVMVIEDKGSIDEPRKFDASYISSSKWAHMTGCSLEWLEKSSKKAQKEGVPLSFDPGRAAAHFGLRKLSSVIKRVDVLILNKKELAALSGSSSKDEVSKLAKKFNSIVILKTGHGPAVVCEPQGKMYEVPPFNASRVVDTLGCGDAFASGVICGRLEKRSFYESIRFGHACAAAKVMNAGAQGMPKRREVRKLFKF